MDERRESSPVSLESEPYPLTLGLVPPRRTLETTACVLLLGCTITGRIVGGDHGDLLVFGGVALLWPLATGAALLVGLRLVGDRIQYSLFAAALFVTLAAIGALAFGTVFLLGAHHFAYQFVAWGSALAVPWTGIRYPLLSWGGVTTFACAFAVLTTLGARRRLLQTPLVAAVPVAVTMVAGWLALVQILPPWAEVEPALVRAREGNRLVHAIESFHVRRGPWPDEVRDATVGVGEPVPARWRYQDIGDFWELSSPLTGNGYPRVCYRRDRAQGTGHWRFERSPGRDDGDTWLLDVSL